MSGINALLNAAVAGAKNSGKGLYVCEIAAVRNYCGFASINDYKDEADYIVSYMMDILKKNLERYQYNMMNKELLRSRLRKVESEAELREYFAKGYSGASVLNTITDTKSYYVFRFDIDNDPWPYWEEAVCK